MVNVFAALITVSENQQPKLSPVPNVTREGQYITAHLNAEGNFRAGSTFVEFDAPDWNLAAGDAAESWPQTFLMANFFHNN